MLKHKKPKILFVCDAKFSSSPKKLATKLQEILPTHKVAVRLNTRPPLPASDKRKIIIWGKNINKLQQYTLFKEHNIPHPEWTTDINVAKQWLEVGHTVVGRTLLNSFGGKGIILFDQDNPIPNEINHCKVFAQYKKKKHEYRVHIFDNHVIDFAQKKKNKEANNNNNVNTKIRNFKNGWVYCRENVALPATATTIAIDAVKSLGLKSGAVDLIWNQHENQFYVLEINTAPGLAGSTINSYAEAFKHKILNNHV